MNWKSTVVILIIALLGGSYIYFFERRRPTTEEIKEKERRVFDFKSEEVNKLEIKRENETILIEKDDGHWQMKKPIDVRADKSEIDSILSKLEFLEWERIMKEDEEEPFNLEEFGLKEPRLQVTFWEKGKSQTIMLGDETPQKDNVYAKLRDKKDILIVAKGLYDKLDKEVSELRDRTVIEVDKHRVEKIELKYPERSIVCVKKDGRWRITQPISDRGDKAKIEDILDKLGDLRVEDFISEDPTDLKKYGLQNPRLEVTVWEKGEARTVLFGKDLDGEKVYCKRRGLNSIYSVKREIIDDLTKEVNELRDKKVVRIEGLNKIEIAKASEKLIMEKGDDSWKITSPLEVKGDEEAIEDFIEEIEELEIEEFVVEKAEDLSMYGLKEPLMEISLVMEGEKEKFFVGEKDKRCYIKRAGEEPVFLVSSDFLEVAQRNYLDFRDRTIFDFSRSDVEKLAIEGGGKAFACEKKDGEWKSIEPEGGEVDEDAIDDVLWDLAGLRAKKLVAEKPKELIEYGLDEPAIKVSVGIKKDEEKILLIGKETEEDSFYGMLEDGELIFEVDSSIVENLKEMVKRKGVEGWI
ncbi:DUF4340 domain-containing protein [candidate division NPL-UPA2 bacterium]|nr:DUF4340 domain-containing protein [candidate division NPL-UPA2 bacterium]